MPARCGVLFGCLSRMRRSRGETDLDDLAEALALRPLAGSSLALSPCSTPFTFSADFPNHSPWFRDWAKYTDEGWYGNAAIRAHLFGNWYLPGDFNPAPARAGVAVSGVGAVFLTGVTVEAARGLAVAFFFAICC